MACSESELRASKHPCYSAESQHKYARMHLSVAPACNIQCNYCNRLFDCVNESRPGVTSGILTPEQAVAKIGKVQEKLSNLAVIGIAGPGDALANWESTKATLTAVKNKYPELILCLSTNGLLLPRYAKELVDLGVGHITVTVNSVDPAIGEKIYKYINWDGIRLHGRVAVRKLMENQMEGIRLISRHGVLIKVNIVMIPGVNEEHVPDVVRAVRETGASLTNIMPLIPAAGSAFAHLPQTSYKEVSTMREICQKILPQMKHCQQCRADAIGLLMQDRSAEFREKQSCPGIDCSGSEFEEAVNIRIPKFRVAVTSKSETLVDQHFGHAQRFLIYETSNNQAKLAEYREVPKYCSGNEYCDTEGDFKQETIKNLADCDAVVTMRIGSQAKARLMMHDILVVEACSSISEGIESAVRDLLGIKRAR